MRKILFIILLFAAFGAKALTLAEQADSAYNKDDYRQAVELYRQSLAQDGVSSDVYYNLGNAYYRCDKPGLAVVCYERALKLDPTDGDARTNLEFVRSRIQDRPEDDSAFLANVHNSLLGSMTANAWSWTAFAVFILLLGAVALYIFSHNVAKRKVGFFSGIVLIFLFAYSLWMAWESFDYANSHEEAVVTAPSTQLTSAPRAARSSADKVVTIHEGTKVEIIDSIATPDDPVSPMWYNVKINNSTKAWLRASDVERI